MSEPNVDHDDVLAAVDAALRTETVYRSRKDWRKMADFAVELYEALDRQRKAIIYSMTDSHSDLEDAIIDAKIDILDSVMTAVDEARIFSAGS